MKYTGKNGCETLKEKARYVVYPISIPPENYIEIIVIEKLAYIKYRKKNGKEGFFQEPWHWFTNDADIRSSLKNLYSALKTFREKHSNYLNNLDANQILQRLSNLINNRLSTLNFVSNEHEDQWNHIKCSEELRKLAIYGKQVYEGFFPKNSDLRKLLDDLKEGGLIKLTWTSDFCPKWLPHLPLQLMFQDSSLVRGDEEVKPENFLGLRYRIEYKSHKSVEIDPCLGSITQTHQIHYLFWGNNSEMTTEVQLQRDSLSSLTRNHQFIPNPSTNNHKNDLLESLHNPEPQPVNFLYFYCCSVLREYEFNLRFGRNNDPKNMIVASDISTEILEDRPLVFVNACNTLVYDINNTNELKKIFFQRECSAYLGTESEVPIILASRFAIVFFHFFYSSISQKAFVSYAVSQTRQFLWNNYKNIGGLFYAYVGPDNLHINLDN